MTLPVGGPSGITWNPTPVFDDEFTGTSLNSSVWSASGLNNNLSTNTLADSSVANSIFSCWVSNSTTGCQIQTGPLFKVGYYVEFYVKFPGTGNAPYNWPAVWCSGNPWPASGEFDIFEGLGATTCNYHYATTLGGSTNAQSGPHTVASGSTYLNSWHTFGCYRAAATTGSSATAAMANPVGAYYYWDGAQVWNTGTFDNGTAGNLIITAGSGNTAMYGSSFAVQVDYVRLWQQGTGTSGPRVQGNLASNNTASNTSLSCAYPGSVTKGNLLLAYCGWYTGVATPGESITDTQGNVWHQAVIYTGTYNTAILYTVASATGANTVTVTFPTGSGYTNIFIEEFTGYNTLDVTATSTAITGTSQTTASATTTKANELIYAGFNDGSGSTVAGSGYTQAQNGGNLITEYATVSTAGSYDALATGASGGWAGGLMATFYYQAPVGGDLGGFFF